MKFLDEYRDAHGARKMAAEIARTVTRPWTLMEVCGGQTHAIVRFGLDELLPKSITLVHGPGCPVCVTSLELIDKALAIAEQPNVIFCSFGDMLRVPGSTTDLFGVKARGGDIRIVYSPMDALQLARENPEKEVVFFAVGFETTAPANAMAVWQAKRDHVTNFSILVSHVTVPPAIEAIMSAPENRVQAFLAAGHVCAIMGTAEYEPLAKKYHVPIVITGFEPLDILQGVLMAVQQLESGRAEVENAYARAVKVEGNIEAQRVMREVFRVVDRSWRGIGEIPRSGLGLTATFAAYDAEKRFQVDHIRTAESTECQSGSIMRGLLKPPQCAAFGTRCTPEHPLGATMVSSEGACAAYFRYRRMPIAENAFEPSK
jgi:hydrogenase expression/formation protein HypD